MKKLIIAIGLISSVGFLGTLQINHFKCAKAEEISESVEVETSEEIDESTELESVSKEDSEVVVDSSEIKEAETMYENISNTAKDILNVIKGVLEQPIVIAGVSTSLGVLIVLVISKLISVLNRKKLNDLISKLDNLVKDQDKKVDYDKFKELLLKFYKCEEVLQYLIEHTKNIKVREEAIKLLKSNNLSNTLKVEEKVEEKVVEEIIKKDEVMSNDKDDNANDIINIVNQD